MMTHSYKKDGSFSIYQKRRRRREYGYMERAVPLFHPGIPGRGIGEEIGIG
jgi:hypothetical protein